MADRQTDRDPGQAVPSPGCVRGLPEAQQGEAGFAGRVGAVEQRPRRIEGRTCQTGWGRGVTAWATA